MAEYIERGAFIEAVKDIPMWGSVAAMLADSIPAADVAPVVHGCFEPCFDENGNWRQGFAKCSNLVTAPAAGRKWTEVRTMPEFRRLTYKTPDGAWGIKGVSLLSCPARLYGAAAKLCDMESLCEDVYRAKDAELTLDALQELVDKGLGGRFLDLRRALKGVTL